jgi:excisionase family DNA binding protein
LLGLPDANLTLNEAAAHAGVHYMTVYRWIRTGRLDARLDGRNWQIRTADLDAALQRDQRPDGSPRPRGRSLPALRNRLRARLLAGDQAGAWRIVEDALVAGASPQELAIDVIMPTLRQIGDDWHAGTIDVYEEHTASVVAFRLVARLGPRFARRGRSRGSVLLGAVEGDPHSLPTAILGDLARGAGYAARDLGAWTPPSSFVRAAATLDRPVAVVVSCGVDAALPVAAATVQALVDAARLPVIVGGAAVDEHSAPLLAPATWVRDARDLPSALDRLHGRARTI